MTTILHKIEKTYRDTPIADLERSFTGEARYALYVHLINAFGYRDDWAASLIKFIRFNKKSQPYFEIAPATPEAHRHKFLITLSLSRNSPGRWEVAGQTIASEDFVAAILEGPLDDWGDNSIFPEPSWTLQFLARHCDEHGRYQGQETPMVDVTRRCLVQYFTDYASGDLYTPGKTIFTESGFHYLEAINKLSLTQSYMMMEIEQNLTLIKFFPDFKDHLLGRLRVINKQALTLLAALTQDPFKAKVLFQDAISDLLGLGHLMEVCLHPMGQLVRSWTGEEREQLKQYLKTLEDLIEVFLDPHQVSQMNAEQQVQYHFPLLHAYHALYLSRDF